MSSFEAQMAYDLAKKAVEDGMDALERAVELVPPNVQGAVIMTWVSMMLHKLASIEKLDPELYARAHKAFRDAAEAAARSQAGKL